MWDSKPPTFELSFESFDDRFKIISLLNLKHLIMNSLKNRVTLIGNLGKDIEVKETKNGRKFAKFSIATNENYKSSNGDKVTDTQWHSIVAWEKRQKSCLTSSAKEMN